MSIKKKYISDNGVDMFWTSEWNHFLYFVPAVKGQEVVATAQFCRLLS